VEGALWPAPPHPELPCQALSVHPGAPSRKRPVLSKSARRAGLDLLPFIRQSHNYRCGLLCGAGGMPRLTPATRRRVLFLGALVNVFS
jgi:hypothetical protein